MKHLVFLPFESNIIVQNRFFVTLENAQRLAEKGEDVNLIYCDGKTISQCWINWRGDKRMCIICNMYRKCFFSTLSPKIKLIPYSRFFPRRLEEYNDLSFQYQSISEIKKLTYEGVKIGLAALSSYISPTRNLYPLLDADFRNHFDATLKSAVITTDIVRQALKTFMPDSVGIFNSRFTVSRPIYDTCKSKGTDVVVYETSGNAVNGRSLTYFYNNTPHNIEYGTAQTLAFWNSPALPLEEKVALAEHFFLSRRNAVVAGDKVYVKEQVEGLLPDNWDNTKHNIVIFNSSEDEYASLGDEFEENIFPSQYQGIKYLFELFKDRTDFHIYLRVHPNLKEVGYAYHHALYDLEKISSNVTVIQASSPISTYALLDNAEKVIVFGSTTGYEAAYWGKPVILLSNCAYSLLDICYIPGGKEDIESLILSDLKPKDKLGALQMAYARINRERPAFQHYQYTIKRYVVLGKKIDIYLWEKSGQFIKKLCALVLQILGGTYRQVRFRRPTKEDPNAVL